MNLSSAENDTSAAGSNTAVTIIFNNNMMMIGYRYRSSYGTGQMDGRWLYPSGHGMKLLTRMATIYWPAPRDQARAGAKT